MRGKNPLTSLVKCLQSRGKELKPWEQTTHLVNRKQQQQQQQQQPTHEKRRELMRRTRHEL